MGKGMYRVVNIPEDEAILLNSREKAPYMICVEILKSEVQSNTAKDVSSSQKLSKGGIPLANGDALLPKPPPWAYPLWSSQDMYRTGTDRMSSSASHAIDQAMAQLPEAKMKFVHVGLSVEKQSPCQAKRMEMSNSNRDIHCCGCEHAHSSEGKNVNDLEWVRVVLTADPGVNMDDMVDQEPPRRKEHRRVPSTVAIEEVKAATLKGEAPPGLPLKGAGQDSSDAKPKDINGHAPKASKALSGELWEVKKERLRKASIHGKLPGWDLRSLIVRSGDDCRQENLAVQLISHFYAHSNHSEWEPWRNGEVVAMCPGGSSRGNSFLQKCNARLRTIDPQSGSEPSRILELLSLMTFQVVESPCESALIPGGAALSAYQYFENVRNYLVAVEGLGLPSFEASDLVQGGKSSRVVNCVLALKSYSEWKQSGEIEYGSLGVT